MENQPCTNSTKNKRSSNSKAHTIKTPVKRPPNEYRSAERRVNPQKLQVCSHITKFQLVKSQFYALWNEHRLLYVQLECRVIDHGIAESTISVIQDEQLSRDENPNKISENILKCLSSIVLRMSSSKNMPTEDILPSLSALNSCESFEATESRDPYGICSEFGKRDIGPYKNLFAVEAASINPNQTTNSVFLVRRLK